MTISLGKRHRRLLQRIFQIPPPANLRWNQVVALVEALGGSSEERAGSRVAFILNGRVAVLHRPHPGNEIRRGALRDLRAFLSAAGVAPSPGKGPGSA